MGMRSSGEGEIVQVEGGHILRSTGRKDRHSKVYTSKGPRDRRVRLSAHTAIQFYDVQDRLGYDRPSKAVDWLIKKAKNAIDKLDELPPSSWNPNDTSTLEDPNAGSSEMELGPSSGPGYGFLFPRQFELGENHPSRSNTSSFIPPSVDAQSISDTMKSFFPTSSGTSSMNFPNYPHDIMSKASIQTEDLCLSLHSSQQPHSSHTPPTDHALFSGSSPMTFELNYPRMSGWNGVGDGESRVGFIFNSQPIQMPIPMPMPPLILCQSSAVSQREPLQSSFLPMVRAWDVPQLPSVDHHNTQAIHQSLMPNSLFTSEGFSGFQVPARIHGEEELATVSSKPSSPPNSHH